MNYFLDSPDPFEAESIAHGVDYYIAVIRQHGRPGWTFRFSNLDLRLARETLAALNSPTLVRHHIGVTA